MNKFAEELKIDNTKNIRYYETALLTDIPIEDVPFYYISKEGDRMDTLAERYYQNPRLWWVIAKANNFVNGSVVIPTGTNVYIPRL